MNDTILKALDSIPEQEGCVGKVWQRFLLLNDLRPNSPSREPDWRWKMVSFLFEFPWLKRHMRHDLGFAMAIKLHKYLQYLDSLGTKRPRKKPLPEGVMEAYALYQLPPRLQAELKARLLAKEALSIIAQKIHSTVAAITWYEHLFFNIFDRLESRSYISHHVTRLLKLKRNDPSFMPAFWMEIGYCAGPEAVDLLVEFQDRILEPLTHEDLLPTPDSKESILRKIKLLIELRTTLYDSSTYHPLLDARGVLELADREEQTKLMIQQTQAIQALSAPLASMHLDYEGTNLDHEDTNPNHKETNLNQTNLDHDNANLDHDAIPAKQDDMYLAHDGNAEQDETNLDHDNVNLDHEDMTAEQDLSEYESILPTTAHETAQKLVI
jgi:hypothetical protein